MATEIKLRRGSTSQHTSFNGAEGEVTFDTDKHTLIVHNNEGNGTGRQVALLSDVQASNELSEMLDVNLTSPAAGSLLKYHSSSEKWIDSAKLTETTEGIDVVGGITANYLDLTGGETIITRPPPRDGLVAATKIVLNDPTGNDDAGTDACTIYTEEGFNNQSKLVIHCADDGNDQIVLRTDNDVDTLIADSHGIDVTGTVKGDSLTIDNGAGLTDAYIASATGKALLIVKSTHNGEVSEEVAGIEVGAKSLSYLDLKTPDTDDYDLRIEHSESANLSMINSLADDLFLRSGAKVALQHAGANTKLETTATGIDVTGTVSCDTSISIASNADQTDPQPDLNFFNNEDDAVGQRIGQFNWFGKNNLSGAGFADIKYGWQELRTINVTDGEESAQHETWVKNGAGGNTRVLQVQPTGIDVTGTVTCDEALTISSDGSGADAKPDIFLYNNATAANGERLGQITYYGKNSATETTNYGWHEFKTVDVTDGVEDSVMEFWVRNGAGNHNKSLTLNKDGIDVTGTVTADGLSLGDGEYARFGDSGDLQMFHSGVHSYIQDQGTGILSIQTNGDSITLQDSANAKNMAKFSVGGTASLYWAGSTGAGTKLSTTETGVNVTGTVDCDTLTTGDTTINGNLEVKSTTADGNFLPEIRLKRDGGAGAGDDGDVLGALVFEGDNFDGTQKDYARIGVSIKDDGTGVTDGRVKGEIRFACADGTASPTLEQPSCSIDSTGVHINSDTNDGTNSSNYYHVDNVNLVAGTVTGGLKFNSRTEDDAANKTTIINSKNITEDHEVTVPNVTGTLVVASIAGGSINGGDGTLAPKSTWSESNFTANPNSIYLHYNPLNTTDLTVSPEYPATGLGDSYKFLNASPQASDIIIDLDGYSGSSVASYALVKTDGSLNATIDTSSHSTITVSSGGFVTLTKVAFAVYLVEGIGYTYS